MSPYPNAVLGGVPLSARGDLAEVKDKVVSANVNLLDLECFVLCIAIIFVFVFSSVSCETYSTYIHRIIHYDGDF